LHNTTCTQWLTFQGASMPQIIKYQCRPEKKLTNQLIVESEWTLPEYVVCLQCQSCGVMGIAVLDKETAYNADL